MTPRRIICLLPVGLIAKLLRRPSLTRWITNSVRISCWNRLGAHLSDECYIDPQVRIEHGYDVTVGRGTALSGKIELAAWGPISIGRGVLVNSGVHFLTASHDFDDPAFGGLISPIVVEDNSWIAQGAVIMRGVDIGEGAVIGAYAVVTKSVPPRTVVAGNPAHFVRHRRTFEPTFVPGDWRRFGGSSR